MYTINLVIYNTHITSVNYIQLIYIILQDSCLRNPTDSGARQVPVHGVTESDMTEKLTLSLSVYTLTSNIFIPVCVRDCFYL